ncbi:hypothetical protein [Nocardia sp. NPDC049149]|uniref:hypothetical protein n=1 Tax=Nocardia sp. NPDC049149 TaxID=3364315 RepID=UPI003720B702
MKIVKRAIAISVLMASAFGMSTVLPAGVAAADPTQSDCGNITCTVRLDRAQTRNARDRSWLVGAGSGLICVGLGGAGRTVCAGVIALVATDIAVNAGRYYEDGNCIGIRLLQHTNLTYAGTTEVTRGTYNCA